MVREVLDTEDIEEQQKNALRDEAAYLLKYMTLTQFVMYLDGGILPSTLTTLKALFKLSYIEQGALGGGMFLALALASPLSGIILRNCHTKPTMCAAFTCCLIFNLAFAATPVGKTWMLLLARASIGITHAFVIIYSPVWVDQFAPRDKMATWMSYLQVGTALGTIFGFILGALSEYNDECALMYCWRWPFLTQIALSLPLCIGLYFVPAAHLEIAMTLTLRRPTTLTSPSDEDDYILPTTTAANRFNVHDQHIDFRTDSVGQVREDLGFLFNNRVYVLALQTLAGLYFVVVCIQFWTPDFILTEYRLPKVQMYMIFLGVSCTAPILGVFMGGHIIDKLGGYQGPQQRAKALKVLRVVGFLAASGAVMAAVLHSIVFLIGGLWICLFFGAAIVPAYTGIMLSVVDSDHRSLASAVAVTIFNLFGYFLGPFLSAAIMQLTDSQEVGFKSVLMCAMIPGVTSQLAYRASKRPYSVVRVVMDEDGDSASDPEI